MSCRTVFRAVALAVLLVAAPALAQAPAPGAARSERKPQPRPAGARVVVDAALLRVDDGDTAEIRWSDSDREVVRVLGIDTPETAHPQHDLPYAQSFGYEARAFAMGAFAGATKIELLRSATLDPYGRTLGYFFLNGRNYSVLAIAARFAEETVTHYGDNGLPNEAAEVVAAAKAAGPLPFESPGTYRQRMRELSRWMKEKGVTAE
jgi:micrococcal nuclease